MLSHLHGEGLCLFLNDSYKHFTVCGIWRSKSSSPSIFLSQELPFHAARGHDKIVDCRDHYKYKYSYNKEGAQRISASDIQRVVSSNPPVMLPTWPSQGNQRRKRRSERLTYRLANSQSTSMISFSGCTTRPMSAFRSRYAVPMSVRRSSSRACQPCQWYMLILSGSRCWHTLLLEF